MFTLNFISKQVKINSVKIPIGEKLPRYGVSENNARFDERTVPQKRPVNFKCQYRFLYSIIVS